MRTSRRKIEELLWITGLHDVARKVYQRSIGRGIRQHLENMHGFYGQLIRPGALVFDVGANVGKFSEVLVSLGARVVAIEPNPDLVRHIQLSVTGGQLEVIQAAVGRCSELAVLRVSDDKDDLSSMSNEWMAAMRSHHKEYESLWGREITVPTTTLDCLAKRYGAPDYVKIDVEGFEEAVLDGLSVQPPLLSFEFNTAFLDATMRCLEKKVFGPESTFNFIVGQPVRFEREQWISKDQLKRELSTRGTEDRPGDIFVKRIAA